MTPTIFGFDPGYIGTAGASIVNGVVKCRAISSVIGTGSTRIGRLDEGSVGSNDSRRRPIPFTVRYLNGNGQQVSYLVGEGVEQYTSPSQRMGFDKLVGGVDSPEMQTLLYTIMGRVLPANTPVSVGIVMGLPVPVLDDTNLTEQIMSGLREWGLGPHELILNTKTVNVNITGIQGIAQPRGSFYYWGMDDKGRWKQSREALTAPVLIIDIGFFTIDLYLIENNEPVPRFTKGETIGMKVVAESLQTQLSDEYGTSVSLHEADAFIRQYLASKKFSKISPPFVYAQSKRTDIAHLCVQALGMGRAEAGNFIEKVVGKRGHNFYKIILTGGGMYGFGNTLLKMYPRNSVMLDRPEVANAIGQARAGVAFKPQWFLKSTI
ncbi:MAG: ParM/StbA family protein [Planctomycetes bacterium]|nr:ParM/StbA family protein [Planctomycetota bacterium]